MQFAKQGIIPYPEFKRTFNFKLERNGKFWGNENSILCNKNCCLDQTK